MISSALVILLSATALTSAQFYEVLPEHPEGHIINGVEATLGQFPHQAWLIITLPGIGRVGCGGSLIHPKWILTAGHCTDGADFAEVILGTIDKSDDTGASYIYMTSNHIITHEDYDNSTINNDISLIELDEEVPLSQFVKPVKLATQNPVEDQNVTPCGFGSTTSAGGPSSDALMWVTTPVLNRADSTTKCLMPVENPLKICIDTEGPKGVCSGDSGGPLNSLEDMSGDDGILYGVTSYGILGCTNGPHVFTSVPGYLGWIIENTGLVFP